METSSESSTSSNRRASRSSPSKSSASEPKPGLNAWVVSSLLHGSVIGTVFVAMSMGTLTSEKIEIEVIEHPKPAPQTLNLSEPPKPKAPPKPEPEQPQRKVFGVSRKALTDAGGEAIKQGNTVATAPDNEKLKDSDADSLPIPTDEYLVTAMPSIASEVRVPYPPEAKQNNVEGPVVMDILIDETGAVRQVALVNGPGYGLNEAAMAAIRQFRFSPAKVGDKAVAVKIRYTYRFVLEK